jgi:Fe-S cluster biogenesis protein NfuA
VREEVQKVIDEIRPAIQMDGGDIELVGVDERGVVSVRLLGACTGCSMTHTTLKAGVERMLQTRVPGVTEVLAV